MKCAEFELCLDGLMDGMLSSDQLSAMEEHAELCPHCSEQLRLTRQMMALFDDMLPEIDVPLEVQAGWRRAVKAEGRKRFQWVRYVASAAAVLVAVFGLSWMARSKPANVMTNVGLARETDAWIVNAGDSTVFAADGASAAEAPTTTEAGPMHEVHMTVEDLDTAIAHMTDLAAEYEGHLEAQRFESDGTQCANLYIDLPSGNLSDFLSAASYLDTSDTPDGDLNDDGEGGTALLVVLRAA